MLPRGMTFPLEALGLEGEASDYGAAFGNCGRSHIPGIRAYLGDYREQALKLAKGAQAWRNVENPILGPGADQTGVRHRPFFTGIQGRLKCHCGA